jgi:transcriptional regulator with XRE-family HTH domain
VEQPVYEKTYLRNWRKKKGLSLRKLAARMEYEPGVQLISHVQLGRIEKGEQPYSQPILEAAAQALGITVTMIVDVDPDKEGDVIDLLKYLKGSKRDQAIEYLRFLAQK